MCVGCCRWVAPFFTQPTRATLAASAWSARRMIPTSSALMHPRGASHNRVMVLEVMGRHAGWIALHSGIAGGTDVILIPEIPYSIQAVADKIRARDVSGSNFSIIVV